MAKRLLLTRLAVVALLLWAAPLARAQNQGFNVQSFKPTPGPRDLIIVPQSQPLAHLSGSIGAFLSFALNPLVLLDNTGAKALDVVRNRFELDLMGAMGLGGWFELGAVMPIILYQGSDNLQATGVEGYVAPTVLGDLSLFGKVPFLKRMPYAKGPGIAMSLRVNFPTGNQAGFASDGQGNYSFNPTLIADYRFGFGALIALQAGVNIRQQIEFFGTMTGPVFTGNAGVELPLIRKYGLTALGGVYFNVPLTQLPDSITQIPAQALLGLRWYSSMGVTFSTGLNFGGDCNFSIPTFTFWLAAVWVPGKTREFLAIEDFKKPPDDPDGDGVIGDKDKCPLVKGPAENEGCPIVDTDRDGIPDIYDDCPNLPGIKAYRGCPRVYAADKQIKVLERVQFATDQDIILPESFGVLQEVAELMLAHKEWQEIRIDGHCDSRASDSYNQDLSERRANAVLRFLLARGVEPSRLRAEGFGKRYPVTENTTDEGKAFNKTEEGMSLNRRVEFTILKVAPGSAPPPSDTAQETIQVGPPGGGEK
jgi:outer membrane protein OmpA-like peptidoglycan-associated protein